MKNVLILAIVLQMQTVRPEITEAFVHVGQALQAILTSKVANQVRWIDTWIDRSRAYENDFLFLIVPEPQIEEQDCAIDIDCPALEICYTQSNRNRCVDPCSTIRPCVANAECKVFSTTPTRTMTCVCFEGYTGNGVVNCDKISKFFKSMFQKRNLLLKVCNTFSCATWNWLFIWWWMCFNPSL